MQVKIGLRSSEDEIVLDTDFIKDWIVIADTSLHLISTKTNLDFMIAADEEGFCNLFRNGEYVCKVKEELVEYVVMKIITP